MIDIGKILKRAWHILWNYKMLWVFGILLALTAGGGGGNGGSGYQFSGNDRNGEQWTNPNWPSGPEMQEVREWFRESVVPFFERPSEHIGTFIWIGVGLLLLILVTGVLFALVRYTSETAILRMVDDYEQTGTKVGFKQGWKLGWTRRAFRLWVIDLVISLPAILFVLMILGLGTLFFVSVINGEGGMAAAGAVTAIGCAFVFIMVFILAMVFLTLLRQFFARAAALEEKGIGDSFRGGWAMFKRNWKSALLTWLVMLGIGFGFGIAMLVVFFLLIPVYAVLLIPALLVAAIPGLIAYGIASLFTHWIVALIIGSVFALPLFFMILFSPLTLVSGWYMLFESSVWTLAYREMKALESLQPAPEPEAPQAPPVELAEPPQA